MKKKNVNSFVESSTNNNLIETRSQYSFVRSVNFFLYDIVRSAVCRVPLDTILSLFLFFFDGHFSFSPEIILSHFNRWSQLLYYRRYNNVTLTVFIFENNFNGIYVQLLVVYVFFFPRTSPSP